MPMFRRLATAIGWLAGLAAAVPAAALPSPDTALPVTRDFYIVRFAEAPLARYAGGEPGLAATNPQARGEAKLDARSPESQAYLAHLDRVQGDHLAVMEDTLGRSLDVVFRYRAVYNGVAVRMNEAEATRVAALPGVLSVLPDVHYPQHTDRGPIFIGAPGIWNGTDTGGLPGTKGEGIIFGDIDSGVNMLHPSFSDTPADAYTYVNPNGSGNFQGWCDPLNPDYSPAYNCNDKLIGAWDFVEAVPGITEADGPEDDNGHGSHTASTTVGNTLPSPAMSGVAPHASIITYDACFTSGAQGLCPFAATSASVEQAVLDGVDVINYSIGGGSSPWGGDIDTFFLDAVAAGVFVSASAGNSGPTASTVAHLGPWVITVGASTHDRVNVFNDLTGMTGGTSPPADMQGASRTGAYGPAPIVHARAFDAFPPGDPSDGQCLTAFPAGTWTGGQIVMCDRGTLARVLKCANVQAGGAGGCILGNLAEVGVIADPHVVPATHVDQAEATALRTWLATGSGHTGSITASAVEIDPAVADIMAGFSSRGPNLTFDALKPDVTNPGVNIFAAVHEASIPGFTPDFGNLSGTSMSSPHTAGSGILLRALHPTWTPSEIKSALMTTGKTADVFKEDSTTPADPFDRGAGRVDLSKAGRVGITLDETAANYLAANPGTGGNPRTLNVPSMQHSACAGSCSWTRTVDSAVASSVTWTVTTSGPLGLLLSVTPASFTLGSGASQALTIQAQMSFLLPLNVFVFGEVTLTPNNPAIPAAHFPIAVRPTATSSIFADGFESGNTSAWSLTVP